VRMVKLSNLRAWRQRLGELEAAAPEGATLSEAGHLLAYLDQYAEQAGAFIPGAEADTDALGHPVEMSYIISKNPELDWEREEIDLDVQRGETDPPPDWLIAQIVRLTGIPESA
jgi:hypothetical protein